MQVRLGFFVTFIVASYFDAGFFVQNAHRQHHCSEDE
jgi:hypothetical protein